MSTENSQTSVVEPQGFMETLKSNLISGFMVFLIALPLCLAISKASGCPPIAGIFTAIAGGILTTFISNSQLTIKGPAAGMIVIVLGCVIDFKMILGDAPDADLHAYRMMLSVAVVSGVIQIMFGLFRSGILGEFFPSAAVHGLLAAIGVIIMAKQIPVALGVDPALLVDEHNHPLEPLPLIAKIPSMFTNWNPEVALIGFLGLIIMFTKPLLKNKIVKLIPAQIIVLAVAVGLGLYFGFPQPEPHSYSFGGHHYSLNDKLLVAVPRNILDGIAFPDFGGLQYAVAWKWVVMFCLIGTLESMLSAKAIDLLDPQKRKTDLNRDILAVGVANTAVAFLGGLPMISEIVRSRANIDNGAKSKYSDMFHGIFLLIFVASVPQLLHLIPLAALAAMLIFTGYRLASPKEFMHMFQIGVEQLVIYVTTIIAVLATDLLVGIAIGILLKFIFHLMHGVPIRSLFKPYLLVDITGPDSCTIEVKHSAIFSNWIMFKRQIEKLGIQEGKNLTIDMSDTLLVDHTVMEKLHELQQDFESHNLELTLVGLDKHRAFSDHPQAARKKAGVAAH